MAQQVIKEYYDLRKQGKKILMFSLLNQLTNLGVKQEFFNRLMMKNYRAKHHNIQLKIKLRNKCFRKWKGIKLQKELKKLQINNIKQLKQKQILKTMLFALQSNQLIQVIKLKRQLNLKRRVINCLKVNKKWRDDFIKNFREERNYLILRKIFYKLNTYRRNSIDKTQSLIEGVNKIVKKLIFNKIKFVHQDKMNKIKNWLRQY